MNDDIEVLPDENEANEADFIPIAELRKILWEGGIPLRIDISYTDINSLETPTSCYVSFLFLIQLIQILIPRMSYLFCILSEVK